MIFWKLFAKSTKFTKMLHRFEFKSSAKFRKLFRQCCCSAQHVCICAISLSKCRIFSTVVQISQGVLLGSNQFYWNISEISATYCTIFTIFCEEDHNILEYKIIWFPEISQRNLSNFFRKWLPRRLKKGKKNVENN